MPIPDFQTIMLPFLKLVTDGKEYKISEVTQLLADEFELTEDERNERISSGEPRFNNRIHWANTHLKKALVLESTGWGKIRITPRGLNLLDERLERIDIKLLMRYPEYVEFKSPAKDEAKETGDASDHETKTETPDEIMELAYHDLRLSLAQDLLERVKVCSPRFFENLVLDILVAMGYGGSWGDAAQSVGKTRDGGIDGVIKQDKLGLDILYIQAKRWENTVGRPVVQAFAGSLDGVKARKGVMITTSQFSRGAIEYADKIDKRIVLIDGQQLAELMIDCGIGVSDVVTYTVKRVDQDYFED